MLRRGICFGGERVQVFSDPSVRRTTSLIAALAAQRVRPAEFKIPIRLPNVRQMGAELSSAVSRLGSLQVRSLLTRPALFAHPLPCLVTHHTSLHRPLRNEVVRLSSTSLNERPIIGILSQVRCNVTEDANNISHIFSLTSYAACSPESLRLMGCRM